MNDGRPSGFFSSDHGSGRMLGAFRANGSRRNWLWLHTVEFEYERQTETRDQDGTPRWIKPDFYYPATNTIHARS